MCLLGARTASAALPEIIVTNNLVLEPGQHSARLIVHARQVSIDGNGATLVGLGQIGDPKSLETAGVGVLIEEATGVTLKNIHVHGFATGLLVHQAQAVSVTESDFSDNYHNPGHGWGELPARGGIRCEQVRNSVFRRNHANRVWDGIHLIDSDENLVADNDFSHCSNTAAKLWHSSRNRFLNNNLSYGIRIDRAAGEVHARDSTGVLIETGSNDNYWYGNDITCGGDGIFIRPLNRWVSRGNVFVENDDGKGRMSFEDDPNGIIGRQCLRFSPNPYPGAYATAIYPKTRDADWNFVGKKQVRFWIKTQNPNLPGFQNAGPVVRLLGRRGEIELKPAKDANLLNDPPFSEARWLWMPVVIPLDGDEHWERKVTGQVTLDRIEAVSLSLDSWGGDPFTVWVDGLTAE